MYNRPTWVVLATTFFLLLSQNAIAQSFFKSYSNAPNTSGLKVTETSNGNFEILTGFTQNNTSYITTNSNGDFISSTTNPTSGFRLKSGDYVSATANDNAGVANYTVTDQNGTIKFNFNINYTAGHRGIVGGGDEFPNGDILVVMYHGNLWNSPGDIEDRTIRYARVNPNNGQILMQGSFNSGSSAVTAPYELETAPDGSFYLAYVSEIPGNQNHRLVRISSTGQLLWQQTVATLERGIKDMEIGTDGGVWYNFTQVVTIIKKTNPDGTTAGTIVPDQWGISGYNAGALVATNDGGLVIIGSTPNRTIKLDSNVEFVSVSNNTELAQFGNLNTRYAELTSSGEIVVTGRQGGNNANVFLPYLLKLDGNGKYVSGSGGNGIDLELTATSNLPTPNIWQATDATVTIQNKGTQTAQNVTMRLDLDGGLVLQGGNEYTATQGSFSPFGIYTWNVGSIAPGSTASITFNLYNTSSDPATVFAQISGATPTDIDSNPANANCCTPNEDDEVAFTFNGNNPPPPPGNLPDLTASDIRLSSGAGNPGEVIGYTFDLTNSGGFAAGDFTVAAYLSTDNQWSGNDRRVGETITGNVGNGTINDVPTGITVPADMPPGNYFLILDVDEGNRIAESNENNNRNAITSFTVTGNQVIDLEMTEVTYNNSITYLGGDQIAITSRGNYLTQYTTNEPIVTKFYLSNNQALGADDIQIGISTGGLNAFVNATIPSNIPSGRYFVVGHIDADNTIPEPAEGNNIFYGPAINIITGNPGGSDVDLQLTASASDPNPMIWAPTSLTYTIANTGSSNSSNVQVEITLPAQISMVLQGGNEYLASTGTFSLYGDRVWSVGDLAAGQTANITFNLYNRSMGSKSSYAQVIAAGGTDADSTPGNGQCCIGVEDDEEDFQFNGGGGGSQLPDFVLTGLSFDINNTYQPGDVIRFTTSGENRGEPYNGGVVTGIYLSSNPTTTSDDILIAGGAPASLSDVLIGNIPSNIPDGTYRVIARIDPNNAIPESNEGNNTFSQRDIIIDSDNGNDPTDFLITALAFDFSTTFKPSDEVRFSTTGQNNGGPFTGGVVTAVYLSTDQNLSANDVRIAGGALGPISTLMQGGIPNIQQGQYWVIAKIDDDNAFSESNENNNVFVERQITIQPGNSGGFGDVQLSMTTSNNVPAQWAFFSVTITATNTSNTTANNVNVKVVAPDEITYKGGDEFSASQGNFQHWGDEIWRVGSLGANQSATITVNFFRLSANTFSVSSQVLDSSGAPIASASIQFGSSANSVTNRTAVIQQINEPFAIVNAYPNPSTDYITIAVYSNEVQTADLEIFSLTGKRVFGNSYDLQEGLNEIRIETINYPTGNYFIKMDPFHPYLRKIDFTKVK